MLVNKCRGSCILRVRLLCCLHVLVIMYFNDFPLHFVSINTDDCDDKACKITPVPNRPCVDIMGTCTCQGNNYLDDDTKTCLSKFAEILESTT